MVSVLIIAELTRTLEQCTMLEVEVRTLGGESHADKRKTSIICWRPSWTITKYITAQVQCNQCSIFLFT